MISETAKKTSPALLIMDADETSQNAVKAELSPKGFELMFVRDLNHLNRLLIDKFTRTKPLALLVSLVLPQSSGYEFARRFQQSHGGKKIPLFITSKYRTPADLAEANSSGADGLLPHPVTAKALDEALEVLRMRMLKNEIGSIVLNKSCN
jgi:CheY-like chemotaxis protein